MKRLIALFLALLLTAAVLPAAFAQEPIDSLKASFNSATATLSVSGTGAINGEEEQINAYKESTKHLVIGEGITQIDSFAFEKWEKLESISFPASLEVLGGFHECTALKSVTVPATVKSIQSNTFYRCTALSDVTFLGVPEEVSFGVLQDTPYKANEANWDGDLFCIASWAVESKNMRNIVIPEGIIGVGITRPGNPEEFLFDMYLPASVRYVSTMSTGAIFHVSAESPYYRAGSKGELLSKDGKTLYSVPLAMTEDYAVPEGVEEIATYALIYVDADSITVPNSVKRIDDLAFYCCDPKLLHLSDELEVVGASGLAEMKIDRIPRKLKEIGSLAFRNCDIVPAADISFDTVPEIGLGAFREVYGIKTVTLPEGMTELAPLAFLESDVQEVSLPASMKTIGEGAFCGCWQLKKITVRNMNCAFAPGSEEAGIRCTLGVPGTTVICAPVGSTAERYAKKYGYEYEALTEGLTTYQDVKPGAWYEQSIRFVTEEGIMTGTGNGQFDPNATASRAMLASILYRLAGSPEVKTTVTFSDVKAGKWYEDAVTWAAESGYMVGVGNGKFGVSAPVSREQMAMILYRYAGTGEKITETLAGFRDTDKISSWAKDGVRWAVQKGLICGRQSGSTVLLAPQGQLTRAELATVLTRLQSVG